jgi:Uma2 family endonuclease
MHEEHVMSTAETIREIEYPESDGKPMGETDLHIHWIIRLRDILKHRYRDERVYVAADLILYYVEGNPRISLVPDVFVVKDCEPRMRETYLLWNEGRAPDVVFEITSKSSKHTDQVLKPRKYALIGVQEYFVFDPYAEYLIPPLAGFRRRGDVYERMEPSERGQLKSQELGITLELDGSELVLRDARTNNVLLTRSEAAEAEWHAAELRRAAEERKRKAAENKRKEAEQDRQVEREARQAVEARAAALEEELRRLRKQLSEERMN